MLFNFFRRGGRTETVYTSPFDDEPAALGGLTPKILAPYSSTSPGTADITPKFAVLLDADYEQLVRISLDGESGSGSVERAGTAIHVIFYDKCFYEIWRGPVSVLNMSMTQMFPGYTVQLSDVAIIAA